jgi:hypothetical protein
VEIPIGAFVVLICVPSLDWELLKLKIHCNKVLFVKGSKLQVQSETTFHNLLLSFAMQRMRKWPATSHTNHWLVAVLNLIRTNYQSGGSFCRFIHWVKGTYKLWNEYHLDCYKPSFDQISRIEASPKTPRVLLTHLLFLFLFFWNTTADPTWQAICIPNSAHWPTGQFLILKVGNLGLKVGTNVGPLFTLMKNLLFQF